MRKLATFLFFSFAVFSTGCGAPDPASLLPSSVIWVAPQDNPDEKSVFATIQAAVQAANGRLIKVKAGTYQESVEVPASATVRLEGSTDGVVALIPPTGKPAWTVGEKADVRISNVRIESGTKGFVVKKESRLHLQDTSISNVLGQGITAEGADVSLLRVTFKNIKNPEQDQVTELGQGQAVRLEGGSLFVDACTFEETGNRGILALQQGTLTVQDSTFVGQKDKSVAAIALQEAQGTVIRAKIRNWKEGIFMKQGRLLMADSTIDDSSGNAMLISDNSWLQLRNTTIRNAAKSGISLNNSGGQLLSNTIENAEEYGIFVYQLLPIPQVLIEKNTIAQTKAAGIQVSNANTIITGNKISGTKVGTSGEDGHGIAALDTDNVLIRNNETKDNAGSGIFLLRSWGRLEGNQVENNKEIGVFVSETRTGQSTELVENKLTKNVVAGVFVLKSKVYMLQNQIAATVYSPTEQAGTGVVIFGGSEAFINGDKYEKNEQDGMLIANNSKANVMATTFAGNKRWGIFLDCSSSTLQGEKNTFSGNGQGEKNTCR
ncbi:MAG: hypothetical protein EP343_30460 [Deltaproteobacteria bacterium]|nr:MAG: hypothetical protein EP343_30460 [Deltaproteobacteria bacterium]